MSGVPILQTFSNQPPLLHPEKKVQAFHMTWNIHIIWYYTYACIKNDIYIYIPGPNPKWFRRFYTTSLSKNTALIPESWAWKVVLRAPLAPLAPCTQKGSGKEGFDNLKKDCQLSFWNETHRNLVMQVGNCEGLRLLLCGVTKFKTNTWMGLLSWEQELDMGALNLGNYGLCVFKMYTIYRIPLSVFNDWSLSSSWK